MAKRKQVHRRAQRRQKTAMPWWLVGAGVVLVLVALALVARGRSTPKVTITPDEVVVGDELVAVHEMTGPQLDQIPFLPKDGPQPKVALNEDFYDFGVVNSTDVVEHTFYLKNIGDAPLTITRAYTTCGCTTARLSATVVPPGKAIAVTVIFDAGYHDVRGQTVRRGVIIENNDPQNPQVEVWIQATVR